MSLHESYADKYASNRSWQTDYELENGFYENVCKECLLSFFGHKHRRVCRVCTKLIQQDNEPKK